MPKDVPGVFSGTVEEIDEAYLGGQKKNKRGSQLRKKKEVLGKESKRGFGATKQAVFGILARSGKVFVRLVEDTETRDLIPIIEKKVKLGVMLTGLTGAFYWRELVTGYWWRAVALGTIPLIGVYDGREGPKKFKWWFYGFYPAHLTVLYALGFVLYSWGCKYGVLGGRQRPLFERRSSGLNRKDPSSSREGGFQKRMECGGDWGRGGSSSEHLVL